MEDCTLVHAPKVNKRNNHQWTSIEEKILIDGVLELMDQGWKVENGFKQGFNQQLQQWMAKKIPGCRILGEPHIKNKLRTLKTQYKEFAQMRAASGFGWNDKTSMVVCDDEVWKSWVQVIFWCSYSEDCFPYKLY